MKALIFVVILFFTIIFDAVAGGNLKWKNYSPLEGKALQFDYSNDNILWIAGSGGLFSYNINTNSWKSYTTAEGLSKIWCKSIYTIRDTIFVGTEQGGANIFDINAERFIPFLQNQVTYITEDRPTVNCIYPKENGIWVGTSNGLYLVDRISLDTICRFTMADGLGENYIYGIVEDEKYLWLATAYGGAYIMDPPYTGGLSRLDKGTREIQNFQIGVGPAINFFWSVDSYGDILWLAGKNGLICFDKKNNIFNKVEELEIKSTSRIKVDNDLVWCVGYDLNGKNKIFKVDRINKTIINSIILPVDYRTVNITIDSENIYLVWGNGLFKINKINLQLEEIPTSFVPSMYSYTVAADNEIVFSGSGRYLVMIDPFINSISKIPLPGNDCDIIRHIRFDNNNLWVSTNRGLIQYDRQSFSIKNHYLNSLQIYFSVPDSQYIWMSTSLMLYKLNTANNQIISKDLSMELNTFGTPQITSLLINNNDVWLSFYGQENGGGLITGIVKLDRYSLTTKVIKKLNIGNFTQAIGTLIDRGEYLIASGNVISKVDKDNLSFETLIPYKSGKIAIKNNILFSINSERGVNIFDLITRQELYHLKESNGLLHNWVNDMSVTDNYCWFSTYAGISGLELSSIVKVEQKHNILPKSFELLQNYPNPFNPSTIISFNLPQKSFVSLKVYDLLGREIESLVSEELPAGNYKRQWNPAKLPTGVYFYQLEAGSFTETKKLIFLR